jgi:hypothetical protein
MMFSVFDEGNTGSNVVVIESIDLGHGTSVNELSFPFPSLPKERPRVPLYSDREIQASQGKSSKHTRKGRDEVDEHEETDEENNKRDKVDEHKRSRGEEDNKRIEVRRTKSTRTSDETKRNDLAGLLDAL